MKTRYLTFYILSTLTVASCSSDFLDIKGQGHVTTTTDPNLAQELVIGAYNGLLQGDSFVSGDIHGFAFISATNIMSDDADKGSTDIDQVSTAG
jgi:starch-binding outer membrane protein, SusD/RagB family